ncbi:MAG TPA: lysophospholipid acyltransferase family protein, partial [Thermoanaerobaculia bacterium]|nr:lysophospholipid acyltransferase family protein [Thermoanaerobaculia bacterium]
PPPAFDDFGYDPAYVAAFGRTLFRFLHDAWWRVEVRGLGNVPREGGALLAGVHRGFMPWDGVMALHLLVRETGRPPRFLLHPTLLKFPFLFDFMTKLGGVPACRANADRVLGAGGLLAIFPEGIRGAFTPYRRAYRLGKFGRDEYVRMALANRAPIVPFVTVGSAETFPILARFEWGWARRYLEWPHFPITPTFPLLPLPLPSKWHTRYLEPLHVEEDYGPEAADDPRVVHRIGVEVRRRMAVAIGEMLVRRRSIWVGSVFDPPPGRRPGGRSVETAAAPGDTGRE